MCVYFYSFVCIYTQTYAVYLYMVVIYIKVYFNVLKYIEMKQTCDIRNIAVL